MKDIVKFLASKEKNFDTAVELYCLYGNNKWIKTQLKVSKNPEKLFDKVLYELGKVIASTTSKGNEVKKAVKAFNVKQVLAPAPPLVSNPATPKAPTELEVEKSKLYMQRAKLSNTLRDFAPDDDAGRAEVIEQIDALTQRMTEIHNQQAGKEPAAKKPGRYMKDIPKGAAERVQELQNVRSNITKTKNAIGKLPIDSNKKQALEEKLKYLTEKKDTLEKLIG